MGELYDVNRLMRRPCNFSQLQNEWPKVVDYLTATDEGQVITTTATNAWHKGGGSPYVVTPLGTINLTPHPSKDWNIPAGWTVRVKKIPGGFRVIDDLLDDKIGTVKLWSLASNLVPPGWAVMDGTSNATVGSGYDMTGKFAKGAGTSNTLGSTGGSTSYTPEGTVSGSISGTFTTTSETDTFTTSTWPPAYAGSVSTVNTDATVTLSGAASWPAVVAAGARIIIDSVAYIIDSVTNSTELELTTPASATTTTSSWSIEKNFPLTLDLSGLESDDIIVPSHLDHYHEVTGLGSSPPAYDNTGGAQLVTVTSAGFDSTSFATQTYRDHDTVTATFLDTTAFGTTLYSNLDNWSHYHTGTTDGHTHDVDIDASGFTFTGEEATIIPPFRNLYYIERIDNSSG